LHDFAIGQFDNVIGAAECKRSTGWCSLAEDGCGYAMRAVWLSQATPQLWLSKVIARGLDAHPVQQSMMTANHKAATKLTAVEVR